MVKQLALPIVSPSGALATLIRASPQLIADHDRRPDLDVVVEHLGGD